GRGRSGPPGHLQGRPALPRRQSSLLLQPRLVRRVEACLHESPPMGSPVHRAEVPETPLFRTLQSNQRFPSSYPISYGVNPCCCDWGGAAVRDPQAEPSDLIRSVSRALRVLEAVGQSDRGLTVKQIARRCQLTVATTYHLVRTLAYEGYVIRREDGTYVVGLEIADRFRELVLAFRGSGAVVDGLRRAAAETGYSHVLARFVGNRAAITAVAEGPRSPHVEDFVPGFDDAAHATSHGKALLATLTPDQRWRFLKETGMRAYTPQTLTSPEALDADLAAG